MLILEDREISTDNEDYLEDTTLWNGALVERIVENEDITSSTEHWEMVRSVREFYLGFNTSPVIHMLVKTTASKFGEKEGSSRYLYRLFPKGPVKQTIEVVGLPKPVKRI